MKRIFNFMIASIFCLTASTAMAENISIYGAPNMGGTTQVVTNDLGDRYIWCEETLGLDCTSKTTGDNETWRRDFVNKWALTLVYEWPKGTISKTKDIQLWSSVLAPRHYLVSRPYYEGEVIGVDLQNTFHTDDLVNQIRAMAGLAPLEHRAFKEYLVKVQDELEGETFSERVIADVYMEAQIDTWAKEGRLFEVIKELPIFDQPWKFYKKDGFCRQRTEYATVEQISAMSAGDFQQFCQTYYPKVYKGGDKVNEAEQDDRSHEEMLCFYGAQWNNPDHHRKVETSIRRVKADGSAVTDKRIYDMIALKATLRMYYENEDGDMCTGEFSLSGASKAVFVDPFFPKVEFHK